MALTIKNLANGSMPGASTEGLLYNPAATSTSTVAIVKSIVITNNNSTTETVNVGIMTSGSQSRRIIPMNLQLLPGYSYIVDTVFTLYPNVSLRGSTTTSSTATSSIVDFTISGVEG